jgi:DNA (cytosine-5)-methyltransferase 1
MKPLRHIGLFEGIGGFSLAGHWAGWQTIAWCEWAAFPQKVLKHHFPTADQLTDITHADFTIYRGQCDVLTGGFPCQPFSVAGSRKGADDHRYLWPHMLRAVQECRPTWVVGENVAGITSMAFEPRVTSVGGQADIEGQTLHENIEELGVLDSICADLEREGYDVQTFIIPACATNAPHRRDRAWIIAHKNPDSDGRASDQRQEQPNIGQQRNACTGNNERVCSNNDEVGSITNAKHDGFIAAQGRRSDGTPCQWCAERTDSTKQFAGVCEPTKLGGLQHATNATGKRGREGYRVRKSGQFDQASTVGHWQNFPTEPPICGGNDGISEGLDISALYEGKKATGKTAQKAYIKWRNETIKAYGNAIVPQVFFEIAQAINQAHQCD